MFLKTLNVHKTFLFDTLSSQKTGHISAVMYIPFQVCILWDLGGVYPKYSLIYDSPSTLTMQPQKLKVTFPPSRKHNCQYYLLLSNLCALY